MILTINCLVRDERWRSWVSLKSYLVTCMDEMRNSPLQTFQADYGPWPVQHLNRAPTPNIGQMSYHLNQLLFDATSSSLRTHYQCLKITSCRWRPPPRMHSFTATTHFKSSGSLVSPCVCCMLCRMRLRRILQSMQHTQGDTKERELLKCVVAVKECVRGGRHLQDVIFKHIIWITVS